MLQIMQYLAKKILAACTNHTAAGNFDGPLRGANLSFGLFTAPTVLGDNMARVDFTEPTDAGLAVQTPVVWGSVFRDQAGNQEMQAGGLTFSLAAAGPVTVRGYVAYDNTTAPFTPVYAELFDQPKVLTEIGDGFVLNPIFEAPDAQVWGGASVSS